MRRGPSSVALVGTSTYHLDVHGDPDPEGGIWITFVAEETFVIADYSAVHAHIGGRSIRLTHREADELATFVKRTMLRRKRPWTFRA